MTKISVVLPSYNYRDVLPEAIESVLAQTFRDWELIIVDDGSTDGAADTAARYAELHPGRIRLFFHEGRANKGIAETYRAGIARASGEYVAFIEADDVWRPENLAKKAAALDRHQDVSVVHDHVDFAGNPAAILDMKEKIRWFGDLGGPLSGEPFYAFKYLLYHNFVLTFSSFMTRRRCLEGVDMSARCQAWLDWWLLSQLSLRGKFLSIPESLVRWRVHEKSLNQLTLRNMDEYREGVLFQDTIFRLMKENCRRPLDASGTDLLKELRDCVRIERNKRLRRWLWTRSKWIVKRGLSPGRFAELKRIWNQRFAVRVIGRLEAPLFGRLQNGGLCHIRGWAILSNGRRISRIDVFDGAVHAGTLENGHLRPDVSYFYKDHPQSRYAGFLGEIRLHGPVERPCRVIVWDEEGRWYHAFELGPAPGIPLRRRLRFEAARWTSLFGVWNDLARRRRLYDRRPGEPLTRILVAGLPKSGTSALFYNIKHSIGRRSMSLFEPKSYTPSNEIENSAVVVLAKTLLARPDVDYSGFAGFDRKVLIVRDPRDRMISALLYSAWNAKDLRDEQADAWLSLLRQKERSPHSVSVRDLMRHCAALRGLTGEELEALITGALAEMMTFHDQNPECFVLKYEDFVDRKLEGLGRFLGFELCGRVGHAPELDRVARTRTYGGWSNWFVPSDAEYFKPACSPFMARYGYADDWTLPASANIASEHAAGYVEQLIGLKKFYGAK